MMSIGKNLHMVRYGTHAEQKYYTGVFQGHYDLLVLNGNTVAFSPLGIASFLAENLPNKDYIIDPLTYPFSLSPGRLKVRTPDGSEKLKSSLRRLSNFFGDPISSVAGTRAITPDSFNNKKLMEDFTERVLQFQYRVLADEVKESDVSKYLNKAAVLNPSVLIAPYFFMTSANCSDWLPLNIEFIKIAKIKNTNLPTFGELVISQDLLEEESVMNDLVNRYTGASPDGILIWIDGFSELSAGKTKLLQFKNLLEQFKKQSIQVYNLYGSYYSLALCKEDLLAGVCHGIQYGEDREVLPVGGGIPRAKFYLPAVFSRLRYGEVAHSIISNQWTSMSEYRQHICKCNTCEEVLAGKMENFKLFGVEIIRPTSTRRGYESVITIVEKQARDYSTRHYLNNKKSEFENLPSKKLADIKEEFSEAMLKFQDTLGYENVVHLKTWHDTL